MLIASLLCPLPFGLVFFSPTLCLHKRNHAPKLTESPLASHQFRDRYGAIVSACNLAFKRYVGLWLSEGSSSSASIPFADSQSCPLPPGTSSKTFILSPFSLLPPFGQPKSSLPRTNAAFVLVIAYLVDLTADRSPVPQAIH